MPTGSPGASRLTPIAGREGREPRCPAELPAMQQKRQTCSENLKPVEEAALKYRVGTAISPMRNPAATS